MYSFDPKVRRKVVDDILAVLVLGAWQRRKRVRNLSFDFLHHMSKIYTKLGHDPDWMKTLVSMIKTHFCNETYVDSIFYGRAVQG